MKLFKKQDLLLIAILVIAFCAIGFNAYSANIEEAPLECITLYNGDFLIYDSCSLGANVTTMDGADTLKSSRSVINTNITNLNTDKLDSYDIIGGAGIDWASTTFTISLDATGDWTGTFDGQEGTYYLARANHTGTQATSTITGFFKPSNGGIGTSTAPSSGFMIIGNSSGGYDYIASSTLGSGGGGGSIGGSDTQIQYNDNGSFAGDLDFTFSSSTNIFSVPIWKASSTLSAPAHQEALIFYDGDEDTFSVYNAETDITGNLMEELWHPIMRNETGSTIMDGTPVYLTGGNTGNKPLIACAQSNSTTTSAIIGLATHAIENNSNGYVTLHGKVRGIDTSSFSVGDFLYASSTAPCELTNVAPTAPNFPVRAGQVRVSNAGSGVIDVNIGPSDVTNGMVIQDLTVNNDFLASGNATVTGALSASQFITPYSNVVTVAKSGGDFTTIQGAINSITDASSTNWYVVKVQPGVYTENIVGKNYISLIGGIDKDTVITASTGDLITFPDAEFRISNFRLLMTPTASGTSVIRIASGTHHFIDLSILEVQSATNDVTARILDIDGPLTRMEFLRSDATYTMTGSAVGDRTHKIFRINNTDTNGIFFVEAVPIVAFIGDVDDTIIGLADEGLGPLQFIYITDLISLVATNPSFTGDLIGLKQTGAGNTKIFKNSIFDFLDLGAGTSTCFFIDSATNDQTIFSNVNNCEYTGGGSSFYEFVGTGDTFAHNFDTDGMGVLTDPASTGTSNGAILFGSTGSLKVDNLRLENALSNPASVTDSTIHYAFNSGGNDGDTAWLFHFDQIGTQIFTNDANGTLGYTASSSLVEQQGTVKKFGDGSVDFVPNDYMDIDGTSTLGTDFILNVRVRFDDASGPIQPIVSGGDGTGANYFQITKLTTKNIRYRIRQGNSNVISLITSGAPVITDTWHDIRFEKTGSTYYAYFDGILEGTETWVGSSSNLTSWRLGSNVPENSSDFLEGYIDELLFTFNSDSNKNGENFMPSDVPYDTSVPFYVLDDGTIVSAVNVGGGNTAASFWTKGEDGRLEYFVNDLVRFIIPEQGAGLASNAMRSFIVSGLFQGVGDEASAISCALNGFWAIDCDTTGTGADGGIRDDFQVLGSGYFAEVLTASSTIIEGTMSVAGQTTLGQASSTMLTVSGTSTLNIIDAGIWNGTPIDISTYTNLSIGATGLVLTGDSIELDSGFEIPLTASTTARDDYSHWSAPTLTLASTTVDSISGATSSIPLGVSICPPGQSGCVEEWDTMNCWMTGGTADIRCGNGVSSSSLVSLTTATSSTNISYDFAEGNKRFCEVGNRSSFDILTCTPGIIYR